MKRKMLCLCLCMMMCLTGCYKDAEQTKNSIDNTQDKTAQKNTEQTDDFFAGLSNELPISSVKVLVNQNGYQTNRTKKIVILGEDNEESFQVIKKDTWETVFSGKIENAVLDKENGLYTAKGDFSEVTEPGVYFIETSDKGRSYEFSIGDESYKNIFRNFISVKNQISYEKQTDNIIDISQGLHILLLALNCHGASFDEEKDIDFVTQLLQISEWLLSCQNQTDGSIENDYQATAAFCGVMTMCADDFGKYDISVYKKYMGAAKKAWSWLKANESLRDNEAYFYASAQLFHITKEDDYKCSVEKYLSTAHIVNICDNMFSYLGALSYLDTAGTDRDICTRIMQTLVDEAEEICQQEKESGFLVYTPELEQGLKKVLIICFVDYVTPSDEYEVVIENTIHYIMGRNETGNCLIEASGEWIDSEKTSNSKFTWNSIMIFCLSDLLDSEN